MSTPPDTIIVSPAGAVAHELDRIADEVRGLVRTTGELVLRIGRALVAARGLLRERGGVSFDVWCAAELHMKRSSAYRLVQVAEAFDAAESAKGIEASALYLLAAGDVPAAARDEALERAERGETITAAKARDIARQHAAADDDPEPDEDEAEHLPVGPDAPVLDAARGATLERGAGELERTAERDAPAAAASAPTKLDELNRRFFEARLGDPELARMVADQLQEARELKVRVAELEKEGPRAHTSAESVEYGTPDEWLDVARLVLERIDLDPFSCPKANERVRAKAFFTKEQDGLKQRWRGRVFMNPPGKGDMGPATYKLFEELVAGHIECAFVVVFNAHTGRAWWEPYRRHWVALPRRPVAYLSDHEVEAAAPPHPSAFVLVDGDAAMQARFAREMRARGAWVIPPESWLTDLPLATEDLDLVARLVRALEDASLALEDVRAAGLDAELLADFLGNATLLARELQ